MSTKQLIHQCAFSLQFTKPKETLKKKIIVKANCGRHEKYGRPRKLPEKNKQTKKNYKSASHYSIDAQTWFTWKSPQRDKLGRSI